MTLQQALATGLPIHAEYDDATFHIDTHGGLDILRMLSNGKTECKWYVWYENAMNDYPLDKLNWTV